MLPRLGSSKLVSNWILITLGASIVAALDGGWLARWTALEPSRIFRGEVWRLVTWPFIEAGPISLVITCVFIYRFGSDLAHTWGERKLVRFSTHILVGAAVVTCLLNALVGGHAAHLGGWAVPDLLVIAWARQFPDRPLELYGVLQVRGEQLVNMTVGAMVLFAIFLGPLEVAPELAACVAAAVYPREWLRKR
jgi:membrane associated rhomboid family serine protease